MSSVRTAKGSDAKSMAIDDFINPRPPWTHNGDFSVLLAQGADTSNLPEGVEKENGLVRVEGGTVIEFQAKITFHTKELRQFEWSYRFILEIRDGAGKLLWRNRHKR